jgi:hypothetical protein
MVLRALPVCREHADREYTGVRAESDVQGPFRSEAPACDHCGFPLLEQADFCPYCERPVGDASDPRGVGDEQGPGGHSERALLIAAAALCAALAVVSIAAAMLV